MPRGQIYELKSESPHQILKWKHVFHYHKNVCTEICLGRIYTQQSIYRGIIHGMA